MVRILSENKIHFFKIETFVSLSLSLLGIWAESESDDEDGNRRGKKQSNMMDINKTGVSFVKSDQKLQDELKERKPSSSNHEFSKQTQSKKKPSRFSGLGRWMFFDDDHYLMFFSFLFCIQALHQIMPMQNLDNGKCIPKVLAVNYCRKWVTNLVKV